MNNGAVLSRGKWYLTFSMTSIKLFVLFGMIKTLEISGKLFWKNTLAFTNHIFADTIFSLQLSRFLSMNAQPTNRVVNGRLLKRKPREKVPHLKSLPPTFSHLLQQRKRHLLVIETAKPFNFIHKNFNVIEKWFKFLKKLLKFIIKVYSDNKQTILCEKNAKQKCLQIGWHTAINCVFVSSDHWRVAENCWWLCLDPAP